jgi:cobalt-zinc-cadmium efflux system membrane fusion protein
MNTSIMRYLFIFCLLILTACQQEEHGHAHDAEGGHFTEHMERPTLSRTIWTERTELFVEFPTLIVGESSRFAAHFTSLDGHKPVTEGKVTVSLLKGNSKVQNTAEMPGSPGIFLPTLQPTGSGLHQLVFDVVTPTYSDRITIDDVLVYASSKEAQSALGEESGGTISFLKEQAWKMDFQTAPVVEKEIYQNISTSGVWTVAPNDHRTLIASSSGQVEFKIGNITVGSPVKKGQVIMSISSAGLTTGNLNTEIQKAKAELDQAKSEFDRKQQLFESGIVPKAEFEQVEQRLIVAQASYNSLSAGYANGSKQLFVPFDGFIRSIAVENGAFVEQGTALFSVATYRSSVLKAKVSPSFSSDLTNIHDLYYRVGDEWSSLNKTGGKILSVSKEVTLVDPMLSVFAQINEVVAATEGSFCEVQLAVGESQPSLVIPSSALLEDYGLYSVIVQTGGERFERRDVTIGRRNGSEVSIKKGLEIGEVVVSKGAYQVKMASMSGQAPAHGHAH